MKRFSPFIFATAALLASQVAMAQAPVPRAELKQAPLSVIGRSTYVGHVPADQMLQVTLAVPYRDPVGIQKFVDDVSNPKSPNYRHFISPEEVAARFGQTDASIKQIKDYFTSQGMRVMLSSRNNLAVSVYGSAAQIESAFATTLNNYKVNNKMEIGRSSYFAYATKLSVPSSIAPYIQYVSGVQNYEIPRPQTTLSPQMARTLYNDVAMFSAGGAQGVGRKVGMLNFDGYRLTNIPLYVSHYGLPSPVGGVGSNVHQVSIGGANGNTQPAGAEGDLDIQALLGQAPLAEIYIYDNAVSAGNDIVGTVARMVSDNTVDVCSASYGFSGSGAFFDALHAQYLSANAEGITAMFSSGDNGTSIEPFAYATLEPEILLVGGTVATTDGSGNRSSEVVWNEGSGLIGGGGWVTEANTFNVLPSWQTGNGVPTTNNHRLSPDVAGHAGGPGGAYQVYVNGGLFALDGTSASSPVFTGQLAIAEQQLISQGSLPADGMGHQRFGRINDLIYSLNGNASVFFDVTSGNIGTLPDTTLASAHAGWDYASGWGSINWQGFVDAVGFPVLSLSASTAKGGVAVTGTVKIASPAGVGGVVVNLSSDSGAAVVPATVTIPQSATTNTFNITTFNSNYNNITAHITATFPGPTPRVVTLVVSPGNSATFVSQSCPSSMTAGQSYPVTLSYKNVGQTTWDAAHLYKLQSRNPANNSNFGANRMTLTNAPVAPNGTGIFAMTAIAPNTTATVGFQWIPIQDSSGVAFGSASPNIAVTVTKVADAARYISRTGTTGVFAGADFFVQYTMMNVGTNSWKDSTGYTLMTINPNNNTTWGGNLIHMPNPATTTIAFGQQVTFTRQCTAPITPGVYTMQWQMNKSGTPFGDTTPLLTMNVFAGPDNASFLSQTGTVTSIGPSKPFNATITMTNLGTATWDGTYSLQPVGSNNFGVTSIVATATAQNATKAFAGSFTSPSTPGTYTFQWRMAHNTTKFGQSSPAITVVVSADAAQFVSRAGATTVFAGTDFFPQYTMKNVGTTTWTQASGYSLVAQNPLNNTVWGPNRLLVPSAATVTPGSTVVCTNLCTTPTTPGSYPMQWQMAKSGVPFGDKTPIQTMTIVQGPDNAQMTTQAGVPTTIVHSATFNATITMKNLGTATWDGTYSLVPIGNNNWSVTSIVATSTAPNGTKAFTATFHAPVAPGTYTFQMRMQHNTTKFGSPATLVTITVT